MESLNLYQKASIVNINHIDESYIYSEGKKIVIFEYLNNFEEKIISSFLNGTLPIHIKIMKEDFQKGKEDLLEKAFVDFSDLNAKEKNPDNVIIKDEFRDQFWEKNIEAEVIEKYNKDDYIYRHYVIIREEDGKDIEESVWDFLYVLKDKNIWIHRLQGENIKEYIYNEINFPYSTGEHIELSDGMEETNIIQQRSVKQVLWDLSGFALDVSKLLLHIVESIFITNKVSGVSQEVIDFLKQPFYKDVNYFKIGYNYKGWLNYMWLPKMDNASFNIFDWIHTKDLLSIGDSIIIDIYPPQRHLIKRKFEKKWLYRLLDQEDVLTVWENKHFIQVIFAFNDISEYFLDEKMNNFIIKFWEDLNSKRIWWKMSRYISSIIGIWNNQMNNEQAISDQYVQNNLIF